MLFFLSLEVTYVCVCFLHPLSQNINERRSLTDACGSDQQVLQIRDIDGGACVAAGAGVRAALVGGAALAVHQTQLRGWRTRAAEIIGKLF